MVTQTLTAETIDSWLCWAGKRLIALPIARVKPAPPHVLWPEFSQELNQFERVSHGFRPLRASAPAKDEIPIMDAILTLPNACESIPVRRILHARSLIHPITDKHLYSWVKIAKLLHSDRRRVQRLHESGLEETAFKADERIVWRIQQYFAESSR